MRSTPSPARRLIAVLTSLALVSAGVVTLVHHVETRHEICAEHGELIHVGTDAGSAIVAVRTAAISNNPLDLDHGDHCAIVWSVSETMGPKAARTATAAVAFETPDVFESADAIAASALWRLAPKTSPPV